MRSEIVCASACIAARVFGQILQASSGLTVPHNDSRLMCILSFLSAVRRCIALSASQTEFAQSRKSFSFLLRLNDGASAGPWLQSAGCVRGLRQTPCRLPPKCAARRPAKAQFQHLSSRGVRLREQNSCFQRGVDAVGRSRSVFIEIKSPR